MLPAGYGLGTELATGGAVAMPTIRRAPLRRAIPPREGSPPAITQPPAETAQYPRLAGAAEMLTMGAFSVGGAIAGLALPNVKTLPFESVSQ